MAHSDSPTWCVACGTFDCYCFDDSGQPHECEPLPESERWWNPMPQNGRDQRPGDQNA
jgi:hypothetical protein